VAGATVAVVDVAARPLFDCDLSSLRPLALGQNSFLYAADGSSLGAIPAVQNRQPVSLRQVSPWLQQATVAAEDRRFWSHGAVDVKGIVRAAAADLRAGRVVQGGSTITQQLVRNLYLGPRAEPTLARKLREICLATKLEERWSKRRILVAYLNHVFYANRAYGAQAAGWTYFSRPANKLDLAQSALIAGLPQAPSLYDPFRHPRGRARPPQPRPALGARLGLEHARAVPAGRLASARPRTGEAVRASAGARSLPLRATRARPPLRLARRAGRRAPRRDDARPTLADAGP